MGISIQQANSMSYFSNTNQVLRKSSGYNESVVSLQKDLTAMGYSTNGVDGYFGDDTKAAVTAFQNAYGLDADGIAGSKTLGKINELINGAKATTVVAPKPTPVYDSVSISGNLQMGSKGSAVTNLQEKLIRMGYNCGGYGPDGDFGTGTYNSVVQFQKNYGLTKDGVVGTQTSQAIANALKTGNNGVPNYLMNKINTSNTVTTTPSAGTNTTGTLQSGSKGNAVLELQKKLINMGYDCGGYGADGDFGTGTYKSVIQFQSDYGLTKDGIVGQQTNQAIANALKTGSNGVPNYIMNKINSISTGKNIEWNNGVPKDIMYKINAAIPPNPDGISVACAFFEGVAEGIVNAAKGLIDSVAHPLETAKGLLFIMKAGKPGTEEFGLLTSMLAETIPEVWDEFSEGNADKKAKMIGNVVGEIIFDVVGTKGIAAATTAIKASVKAGKFAGLISDIRRGIKTIDKVEDVLDDIDVPPVVKGVSNPKKTGVQNILDTMPELIGTNREKLLATIQNEKLSKIVNELYRPGATIGDGGTAASLVDEFSRGSSKHLQKANERVIQLKKIVNSNELGLNDLDIAEALLADLEKAINLFE